MTSRRRRGVLVVVSATAAVRAAALRRRRRQHRPSSGASCLLRLDGGSGARAAPAQRPASQSAVGSLQHPQAVAAGVLQLLAAVEGCRDMQEGTGAASSPSLRRRRSLPLTVPPSFSVSSPAHCPRFWFHRALPWSELRRRARLARQETRGRQVAEADDISSANGAGVDRDAAKRGKGYSSRGGVGRAAGQRRREIRRRPRRRSCCCGREGEVLVGVWEGGAVVVRHHSQERVRERGVDLGSYVFARDSAAVNRRGVCVGARAVRCFVYFILCSTLGRIGRRPLAGTRQEE